MKLVILASGKAWRIFELLFVSLVGGVGAAVVLFFASMPSVAADAVPHEALAALVEALAGVAGYRCAVLAVDYVGVFVTSAAYAA